MPIRITPGKGNAATLKRLSETQSRINKGIRTSFFQISRDLESTAKRKILQKNKSGRTYTLNVNGRTVRHRASAPGEAPAALTRNLNRNISTVIRGSEEIRFGVEKGAAYGKDLELGNKSKRIEPRPFLQPSMQENIGRATATFVREILRELKP